MPCRDVAARGGFTLVEVMVALVVGGMVVLAAHRITVGVLDGVGGVARARLALDREANARRLLAALVGGIEVNREGNGFSGQPDAITFTAWQPDGAGRATRGRVLLRVERGALVLRGPGPDAVLLLEAVDSVAVDYLLRTGADERFVRRWESDAGPPAAIRLRISSAGTSDTLLLLVGGRG